MLNLFCHFWPSIKRYIIAGFIGVFVTLPAYAQECEANPVFAFTKALYLSEYQRASSLIPVIEKQRNPELARFFSHLLAWKTAYDQQDKKNKALALKRLDEQIDDYDLVINSALDNASKTTIGNIMFHAARMNFASGNIIRASNLAKRANTLLLQVFEQEPDNADIYLALGLYQYYTGNDEDDYPWIRIMLSLRGDKNKGRAFIRFALENSPDYAFEAARSLVSDLNWHYSDTCQYPALINSVNQDTPFEVIKLEITQRLFCRQIQRAQSHISNIDTTKLDKQQRAWLYEANLYTRAALGKVNKIQQILSEANIAKNIEHTNIARFYLAKVYDANGEYTQAQEIYAELSRSDLRPEYKSLAKTYGKLAILRKNPPYSLSVPSTDTKQFECQEKQN